jgi:hypothetical protein
MSPFELQDKVKKVADQLQNKVEGVDRGDLELILWNIFRIKKNPTDFLLKKVGDGYAR